jgi:endonuclease/exonuclease/phosphatase family metal-dependent hydrolase
MKSTKVRGMNALRPGLRSAMVLWLALAGWVQALTVATYNIENYTIANRMVEGVYRQAYPKPEKERAALAQVIGAMKPDVLAVCEMGPPAFLAEFQSELKLAGQNYPYAVLLEAADADRHVAVLSKVPFKEVKQHTDLTYPYFGQTERVKRGLLEVIVPTTEGEVSVFVIHLKSKFTERRDDPEASLQRASEAEAVRDRILARFPDPTKAKYLLVGDWNDTKGTRPVRALQKRGETVIGTLVNATDSRGETWTHFFRREDIYSRIDFILMSPALAPHVVADSAKIYDGPGTADASDHRPVVLELKLRAAK